MTTRSLLGRTVHAVTHPVSSAAYVVGIVRGTAAVLLRAASGGGGRAKAEWSPPREAPVVIEADDDPESRMAHDLGMDPELDPRDDAEPLDVLDALKLHDDEVDEGELKAILSESEILRKAADVDKR